MTEYYEPAPSAEQIMKQTAQWVALVYRVQIQITIDDGMSSRSATLIDRRPAHLRKAIEKGKEVSL